MNAIDAAMEEAVATGVFPAAELLVTREAAIVHHAHYGHARRGMLYDIASLTKPVATTSVLMHAIAAGHLQLGDRLIDRLPGVPHATHTAITIGHCLRHMAGYPAWQPYFQEVPERTIGTPAGREMVVRRAMQELPVAAPGTACTYSDIGFILLGEVVERTEGHGLERLFDERIARPVGMTHTHFRPLPQSGRPMVAAGAKLSDRRFAPTEDCPWRRKTVHGEVHDQNCYAMGGVAGHAGLFSTAADLHRFAAAIHAADRGRSDCFAPDVVRALLRPEDPAPQGATWVYGWDRPAPHNSQAGRHFSRDSIGHLGYTGCSLWIDLEQDFWIILLTNRVHPSTTNEKIRAFRPLLHDVIYESLLVR
ncbi:MAG: beta-lactamase family protein [Deltaproteobacteria bacterium]|nr:beta-lactamase family protein [Deltaproteobacteria bacterium]